MQSVELGAVPPNERTQSAFDLFLIFVGANVVATTLQVGASLAGRWSFGHAMLLILIGAFGGAALVAALSPLGPRLGVPSIVASRAALGHSGAQVLAFLLFATNFASVQVSRAFTRGLTKLTEDLMRFGGVRPVSPSDVSARAGGRRSCRVVANHLAALHHEAHPL